ncbi:MAG: hypothetical protein HQK79_12640 [Desulfobacterales bacterium]|nr:hypothetical protein [Desulfobacterales bacterium]
METVKIIGYIVKETEHSVLFNSLNVQLWISESIMSYIRSLGGQLVEIAIPQWLARENKLIC